MAIFGAPTRTVEHMSAWDVKVQISSLSLVGPSVPEMRLMFKIVSVHNVAVEEVLELVRREVV